MNYFDGILECTYIFGIIYLVVLEYKKRIKICNMGDVLFEFKRRINRHILFGIIYSPQIIYFESIKSNLNIFIVILHYTFVLLIMIFSLVAGIKREKVYESGIVTYNGIYKWYEINSYSWLELLNNNKRIGVKLIIDGNPKLLEKDFYFRDNDEVALMDIFTNKELKRM